MGKKITPKDGETMEDAVKRATAEGWAKSQKPKKGGKKAKGDEPKALNAQQELFCRQYVIDFNATQAAIRAGYSQKTAYAIGCELLKKPHIQAFIRTITAPVAKRLEITQERVLEEYAKIAFANVGDFIKVDPNTGLGHINLADIDKADLSVLSQFEVIELPPFKTVENGEEISREVIKVKIKTWDKVAALDRLRDRLGMNKPVEVNVNHSGRVSLDNGDLARKMAFLLRLGAEQSKQGGTVKDEGTDRSV